MFLLKERHHENHKPMEKTCLCATAQTGLGNGFILK